MDLHDPQYQGFFVCYQNKSSDAFADYCYQDIPVDNLYQRLPETPGRILTGGQVRTANPETVYSDKHTKLYVY